MGRNWAQKLVGVGATWRPPKIPKEMQKGGGRCGHVAAECSGVAGAPPPFAKEGCRPSVHSSGIPAISFLKLQIKGLGFR